MLRSPSIIASYRHDDSSSPDPLTTASNDENDSDVSVTKRHPAPNQARPTLKHTRKTSETSRTETAPHSSSPFRSIYERNCSPWKIKVTVEAEPEDSHLEGTAPVTMTRTMKIPLRQDTPSADGVKPSVRGRRGSAASTKSKRSATPVRETRNSSRSRRQSVTNLDVIPLGDDAEEDDWLKQKKSPRKKRRSQPPRPTRATTDVQPPALSTAQAGKSTNSTFEILQDTDVEERDRGTSYQKEGVPDETSPELRSIDINRVSLRPRAMSTKAKAGDEQADRDIDRRPMTKSMGSPSDVRKVSANSAMSYPTPSPSSSYHGNSDDIGNALPEDPASTHVTTGFDTVLESEGFTMIDLDTLPSAKQYRNNTANLEESNLSEGAQKEAEETSPESLKTSEAITYPALNVDESDISSTVPSSPPVSTHDKSLLHVSSSSSNAMVRKVTPLTYSSPKLPSPPRQMAQKTSNHRHRGSASALFAGIALQEIVSPEHSQDVSASKGEPLSRQSGTHIDEDRLYQGFDAGTKRELRAGLRFGEELARRRSENLNNDATVSTSDRKARDAGEHFAASRPQGISKAQQQTQVWRGETFVQHTPVGSASTTGPNAVQTNKQVFETPQIPPSNKRRSALLDTQARREREWQLEREAVSRQIENASESQVVVIDSDDESQAYGGATWPLPQNESQPPASTTEGGNGEGEEDDDEDIWLAEAKNSSSPQPESQPCLQPPEANEAENVQDGDRKREVISRPRRSVIPNTWRRAAPVDQSTFLSTLTDDMSGLMGLQDQESKIKFGAGEIRRQQLGKRRNSGAFDIDAMLGTPAKNANEYENIQTPDSYGNEQDQRLRDDTTISACAPEFSAVEQDVESSAIDPTSPEDPLPSSPEHDHVKIPVNFDASSIAITTPPDTICVQLQPPSPAAKPVSSPQRPPTPRSAMKGARQSFGMVGLERPDTPTMIRRVNFSQRSRGVDIDGLESSFSMKTASDDTTLGEVGAQLNRELQAHEDDDPDLEEPSADQNAHEESLDSVSVEEVAAPQAARPGQGLMRGWILGPADTQAQTIQAPAERPRTDTSRRLHSLSTDRSAPEPPPKVSDNKWQQTKSSIASGSRPASAKIPSYLLPPSYPSDPKRQASTPLALRGAFTNAHFRTLHIIYRKSLRPKFHAPSAHAIRPEIRALDGLAMDVDETDVVGLGEVFTFTVGTTECQVLERFMQECEYSCGLYGRDASGKWGWSALEIAERLCRIVVGEVVRDEERRAAAAASAKKAK